MSALQWSTTRHKRDNRPKLHTGSLSEFTDYLQHRAKQIRMTREEFAALTDKERAELKNGPAVVLATFDDVRDREHLREITGATFDLDSGSPSIEEVQARVKGLRYVLHESASSKPEDVKLRLFVFYDRPVDLEEHRRRWDALAKRIDRRWIAKGTFGRDPERLCFLPPQFSNGRGCLIGEDGEPFAGEPVKRNGNGLLEGLQRLADEAPRRVDIEAEAERIRSGESYHESMLRISASMAGRGEPLEEIERTLYDLLDEASKKDPDVTRVNERWEDVPRVAKSAVEKFGLKGTRRERDAEPELPEDDEQALGRRVSFAEPREPLPVPVIEHWLPRRVVTLLGAHGGVGKSFTAMEVAVRIVGGLKVFDCDVHGGPVLFLSCEDEGSILRWRADHLAEHLEVPTSALIDGLHLIDMTSEKETELYAEGERGGAGRLTRTFARLRREVLRLRPALLIIDNASDVYAANENARAPVRAFMRHLKALAQECDCAILLLAHTNKATADSKAGEDVQGYSGSTAWHNSARSRWFMARTANDRETIELSLDKANYGRSGAVVEINWHDDKKLMLTGSARRRESAVAQSVEILRQMAAWADAGVEVFAGMRAQRSAQGMLRSTLPGLRDVKPGALQALLDKMVGEGMLEVVGRVKAGNTGGVTADTLRITAAGRAAVGG